MAEHSQTVDEVYHINKIKNRNPMIFSINVEKAFEKIQYPFIIKTINKVGQRKCTLTFNKSHM